MRALATVAVLVLAGCAGGASEGILLASTTSARDTGLLDLVEREFERDTGIGFRYLAVGSGQAIEIARRGDADAVLAHSPEAEERFVREGFGVERRAVMRNEFFLVGPLDDPVGVAGERNVTRALLAVHAARAAFVSRGDDSGTHVKELALWRDTGLDSASFDTAWYKEAGAGMAATLRIANEIGAYTLTDDGTWWRMTGSGEVAHLAVVIEGEPPLENLYSVIPVAPERHPHVRADLARAFADWITSPRGQAVVASLEVEGHRLFTPVAEAAP